MLLLSVGFVVVSVAVAVVVAAYSFARLRPLDPRAAALRIAAAAAALSVGSAVMRLVGDRDVNVVSATFPADTTFVPSIDLMCVAMTMRRDPDARNARHGISTTLASPMPTLTTYLTYEYGWQPHEIALIDERTEQRAA